MKKFIIFISALICSALITSCGHCNNETSSDGINFKLPNGSTLSVPASGTHLSVVGGESTGTAITLSGGSAGMDVLFSSSVTPSTTNTSKALSVPLESQIVVKISPVFLTTGGTHHSDVLVTVDPATAPGTYLVNLKATYRYNGVLTEEKGIGTIVIVISPPGPAPKPFESGAVEFSPESQIIHVGGSSFTTVLTLSGDSNVESFTVNLEASSTGATVSPASCELSSAVRTCDVTITAVYGDIVEIRATAAGYTIKPFVAIIPKPVAFIANGSDTNSSISSCVVESSGEINLSTCVESDLSGTLDSPTGIVISGSTMYISNSNSTSLTICSVIDDVISNCSKSYDTGYQTTTGGISMYNGLLYVTGNPNTLITCLQGGGGCTDISSTSPGFTPGIISGITFTESYAYIANQGANSVEICTLNPTSSSGAFSSCTTTAISNVSYNNGVTTNPSNTMIYITAMNSTTYNYSLSYCEINQSTGLFGACVQLPVTGFNFGSANNPTVFNNRLYVPSSSNDKLAVCPVAADGSLSTCTFYPSVPNPTAIYFPPHP